MTEDDRRDDLVSRILEAATDDDLQRLGRVIAPALKLNETQRRVGFEVVLRDIVGRVALPSDEDAPGPGR